MMKLLTTVLLLMTAINVAQAETLSCQLAEGSEVNPVLATTILMDTSSEDILVSSEESQYSFVELSGIPAYSDRDSYQLSNKARFYLHLGNNSKEGSALFVLFARCSKGKGSGCKTSIRSNYNCQPID